MSNTHASIISANLLIFAQYRICLCEMFPRITDLGEGLHFQQPRINVGDEKFHKNKITEKVNVHQANAPLGEIQTCKHNGCHCIFGRKISQ